MTMETQSAPGTSTARLVLLFFAVAILTALELGTATTLPEATRPVRVTILAGLAITKASLLLWYFMNLGRQPRRLRAAVLTPIVFAAVVAVVLMVETSARLRGGP